MPELPEVETVRKGLEYRLANFQITRIEVCRESAIASPGGSKKFAQMLKGVYVGNWFRRGKYLLASLHKKKSLTQNFGKNNIDCGLWGVHLRMTGHFQWHPVSSTPCSHTRVRFWNTEGEELRFVDTRSFGQMWWIPPGHSPEKIIKGLGKLGPEPFSSKFNSTYLADKLRKSKRPIKSALLDQSVVAGIGNIYADESLFSAGINPHTRSCDLKQRQLNRLCSCIIDILKKSIGEGGTTFSDFRDLEGTNGNYGGLALVYRRGGERCRVCEKPIKRDKLSGRSTHWCPGCQK